MDYFNEFCERVLDSDTPPDSATGLTFRDRIYKCEKVSKSIMFWRPSITTYFIFRVQSGSYDYQHHNEEGMRGGYSAHMGYWYFDDAEERDAVFELLIKKGYAETTAKEEGHPLTCTL